MILKTYNEKIDDFIQELSCQLEDEGVDLIFSTREFVIDKDGFESSGFFDDSEGELSVGIGGSIKEWFTTLLHESSHFDQWMEECDAWENMSKEREIDACTLLFQWIEGETELSPQEAKKCAELVLDMELDCEKRTLVKIDKIKCDFIDREKYIKGANSYVLFYRYIAESRTWFDIDKKPYERQEILDRMPVNLDGKLKLTNELRELYKQCCE